LTGNYTNPWSKDPENLLPHFKLDGKTVFKKGVRRMSLMVENALEQAGLAKTDIQHYLFHQANGAMILMTGKKLGLEMNQVPINLDTLANTTSATIPTLLHQNIENGRIKRDDNIAFISFGGGITAGAIIMKY